MAIEDEIAWFDSNRAFISQQYNGQWVVIKDKAVRGAYPTQDDALKAALKMFGTEKFLIKQALPEEKVQNI